MFLICIIFSVIVHGHRNVIVVIGHHTSSVLDDKNGELLDKATRTTNERQTSAHRRR